MKASEIAVGTRVNVRGVELTVTRKDAPFLGRDNMILLVESTDERWACVPVTDDMDVDVIA